MTALIPRPEPPESCNGFVPAPDLADWVRRAFLEEDSPFWTVDHEHLVSARIVWSWTDVIGKAKGRILAGQAQLLRAQGKQWPKLRDLDLIGRWWKLMPDYEPETEPDFLITLYSTWVRAASDASFAALVDHELFHAGQAVDQYGAPKIEMATGRPVWEIRGHSVEEFTEVVRRWGTRALPEVELMVQAARRPPEIAEADILIGCGTCHRRSA